VSPTILDEPPHERADVDAGLLPARYGHRMQDDFLRRLAPLLAPGVSVLDVGAGRSPTIAREHRPPGCRYVGLDISRRELDCAEEGAYDRTIVHDVTVPLPLGDQPPFDVVISWQVLEHVKPIGRAFENLRQITRPGGTMLAQISGSFAAFALLARVVPHDLRVRAMARFLGHPEELKFPTHYDRCYARALERALAPWSSVTLQPYYRGAVYFGMWRPLQRAYLRYESMAERRDLRNLATHYLVAARR
jgi:SAM-dependent methyltransferase